MTDSPTHMADSETLVQALQHALQQHTGAPVQLLQTHISWVLLAGDCAYKLKKPVRFPFLDFSTPALRQHFCEEEVRLNRRLAPELYLDVLPVQGTPAAPRLSLSTADASPAAHPEAVASIDHLVRMHRFAADSLLSERVQQGLAGQDDMRVLAQRLATFHQCLPGTPPEAAYGSPALVLEEVLKVLQPLDTSAFSASVPQWRGWVQGQAQRLHAVWQQRRDAGWVRECHGDLHLGNVVKLADSVTAFDCIDFQPAMRWIDVANDVAFLTMDLQVQGRPDLAAGFMDDYLQASGDYDALAIWRFYEVYRALVRAMVAQLSCGGTDPQAGLPYAQWLDRATGNQLPQPRLVLMHGVSGSGKSTVARQWLEHSGAVRVRSDVERKRLFGLEAGQNSQAQGLDIYTAEATAQTFARLQQVARTALQGGYPVVVDAAFLRQSERQNFRQLADALGVPFTIADCDADEATLVQRVQARQQQGHDASEATAQVLAQQLRQREPLTPQEQPFIVRVDTARTAPAEAVQRLLLEPQG